MNYVSRAQWGARSPKYRNTIPRSNGIFLHHTVTGTGGSVEAEKAELRQIQNYHMNSRGWADIAYSWLVGQSGTIYEGRGWGVQGGHTEGHNSIAHAVCFIGNSENDTPTEAAKVAIVTVMNEHDRRFGRGYRKSHRDVASTACPGRKLNDWLKSGGHASGSPTPPPANNTPAPPANPGGRATVRRGSTGESVKELQRNFNKINDKVKLAEDGIFGQQTEDAVRAFQGWMGLSIDGIVGANTWKALDMVLAQVGAPNKGRTTLPRRVLKKGSKGADVATLQRTLNQLGSKLSVDSVFGAQTDKAVRGTQAFWKLTQDGIVGAKTWATLEWLINL